MADWAGEGAIMGGYCKSWKLPQGVCQKIGLLPGEVKGVPAHSVAFQTDFALNDRSTGSGFIGGQALRFSPAVCQPVGSGIASLLTPHASNRVLRLLVMKSTRLR